MTQNLILNWNQPEEQDRIDLVFENRFKNYGAYALRRNYNTAKIIATFLACSMAFGLSASAYWYYRLHPNKPQSKIICEHPGVTVYNEGHKPDKPEIVPPKAPEESHATQNAAASEFSVPIVEPNTQNPAIFNNNDEMDRASDHNSNGTGIFEPFKGEPGETDLPENEDNGTIYLPEAGNEAMYVKGIEAFNEKVRNEFVFPTDCQSQGINAKIELQFIVSKEGLVSDIRVLKGCTLCPEYEKEAIRILQSTNRKWIPASINRKFVNSYRRVPIDISINEQ